MHPTGAGMGPFLHSRDAICPQICIAGAFRRLPGTLRSSQAVQECEPSCIRRKARSSSNMRRLCTDLCMETTSGCTQPAQIWVGFAFVGPPFVLKSALRARFEDFPAPCEAACLCRNACLPAFVGRLDRRQTCAVCARICAWKRPLDALNRRRTGSVSAFAGCRLSSNLYCRCVAKTSRHPAEQPACA